MRNFRILKPNTATNLVPAFNGYNTLREFRCSCCDGATSTTRRKNTNREYCPNCIRDYGPNVGAYLARHPQVVAEARRRKAAAK